MNLESILDLYKRNPFIAINGMIGAINEFTPCDIFILYMEMEKLDFCRIIPNINPDMLNTFDDLNLKVNYVRWKRDIFGSSIMTIKFITETWEMSVPDAKKWFDDHIK